MSDRASCKECEQECSAGHACWCHMADMEAENARLQEEHAGAEALLEAEMAENARLRRIEEAARAYIEHYEHVFATSYSRTGQHLTEHHEAANRATECYVALRAALTQPEEDE